MNDNVNHPAHYATHPSGVECHDITRFMSFDLGNAVKYVWRAGAKDPAKTVEDLRKALWYIANHPSGVPVYVGSEDMRSRWEKDLLDYFMAEKTWRGHAVYCIAAYDGSDICRSEAAIIIQTEIDNLTKRD